MRKPGKKKGPLHEGAIFTIAIIIRQNSAYDLRKRLKGY